ncbi:MAG: hypothetical protein LUG13_06100 [Oscillospiraceae bacterium]|nr:hypothetical protein [Oscillospiraceae bacterium]
MIIVNTIISFSPKYDKGGCISLTDAAVRRAKKGGYPAQAGCYLILNDSQTGKEIVTMTGIETQLIAIYGQLDERGRARLSQLLRMFQAGDGFYDAFCTFLARGGGPDSIGTAAIEAFMDAWMQEQE